MAEFHPPDVRELLAVCDKSAVLSECGKFRYSLGRSWSEYVPSILFVMLNPSTADALTDDATIRRCAGFAASHGYGGIEVVNLFAYRATDPKDLRHAGYPVGPRNDKVIRDAAERASSFDAPVCVAWGSNAAGLERPQVVLKILRSAGARIQCLKVTRSGYPQHPLMLPSSCMLMDFDETTVQEAMHG